MRVGDERVLVHPFCPPLFPTQVAKLELTASLSPVKVAVKFKVEVNPAHKPLLSATNHNVVDEAETQVVFWTARLQLMVAGVSEDVVSDDVFAPIVLVEAAMCRVVDEVVFGDDAR